MSFEDFEGLEPSYNRGVFQGAGYIGGTAAPTPPDGRTRVNDEVAPLRVLLFDGRTRKLLDETRSKPDGTWGFYGLKLGHRFAVEFVNDGQYTDTDGTPYNSFVQDFIYATPMEE